MERSATRRLKVYLAAPLFTQHERSWNRELALRLERGLGCSVTLPQEIPVSSGAPVAKEAARIFRQCLAGLDACDVVVAVLDGPDADSGTAFEVGYAYALGKPVVGVRTDFREQQDHGTNLMLGRSCSAFVRPGAFDDDLNALAAALVRQVRRVMR